MYLEISVVRKTRMMLLLLMLPLLLLLPLLQQLPLKPLPKALRRIDPRTCARLEGWSNQFRGTWGRRQRFSKCSDTVTRLLPPVDVNWF